MIELDLLDAKQSTPVRLIAQTILERTGASSSVMKKLYRFRVVKLGEPIQTHRPDRIRLFVAKQTCQGSRRRCFGAVPKRRLAREPAINKRRQRIFV